MALQKWPDLAEQGWQLAVLRHFGGAGFSLALSKIDAQSNAGDESEIKKFGFSWNEPDSRWETDTLRFRVTDVQKWFPAFTLDQMRPMRPLVIEEVPGTGLHAVEPDAYPTDRDLSQVDSALLLSPVFMSQEEFEDAARARAFSVGEDDSLEGIMEHLEPLALSVSDRRRVAASALHSVGEVGASLHVIDRVGEVCFNPPLRFYPEGEHPGKRFADFEALQFAHFLAGPSSPPLEMVSKWLGEAPRLSVSGNVALVWDRLTGNEIEDFKGVAFSSEKNAFAWTERNAVGKRTVRWLNAKLYLDAVKESLGAEWVQGRPLYGLVAAGLVEAGWVGEQEKTWTLSQGDKRYMAHFLESVAGNGHFMMYSWDGDAFVPVPGVRDIPFTERSNPAEIVSKIVSAFDGLETLSKKEELTPSVGASDGDGARDEDSSAKDPGTGKHRKKIEDVGEKIGGARKDFFRKSMTVKDLEGMTTKEKMELVTLSNVWPLDLRSMKDAGVAPGVAAYLRNFRRTISKPGSEIEAAMFVQLFGCFRRVMGGVKTPGDLLAAFKAIEEAEPYYHRFVGFSGRRMMGEGVDRPYEYRGRYEEMDANPSRAWNKLLPKRTPGGDSPGETSVCPLRPHLDSLDFVGPSGEERALEFRGGRDVSAEDLIRTFGFRGIEFGNWLPQDERQRVVNFAYDSSLMLARIMGVSPKVLSLNGVLAVAFGARGHGLANAHFEPGRWVVNMTRIRGAGSFCHEFFHALDLWLGTQAGFDSYLSKNFSSIGKGNPTRRVVPEESRGVAAGIRQVLGAIQTTPLTHEAALLRVESSYQRGLNWSKSWVQGALRNALKDEMMDPERAVIEADGRLDALYDRALLESENSSGVGFDPSKAAEIIYQHLRERYNIRLGRKATEQVRINLCSVLSAGSVMAKLKLPSDSPEYQTTLAQCVEESSYLEAARRLDKSRKGRFLPPHELAARAFECFIFDTMKAEGLRDDYLVYGVEEDRFADESRYVANPYPCKEERVRINRAFQAFAMEVKAFMAPGEAFHVPLLTTLPDTRRAASPKL